MSANHVMVDVECLSLKANAVILSIGAVRFDPKAHDDWTTLDYPSRAFYTALSMDYQVQAGGHIDPSTLAWWMRQSPDATKVFEESNAMPLHSTSEMLQNFQEFLGQCDALWANPSHFDYPKLLWLHEINRVPFPCDYWKIQCGMTLKNIADPGGQESKMYVPPSFISHNALEDAKKQVLQVQLCLRLLRS